MDNQYQDSRSRTRDNQTTQFTEQVTKLPPSAEEKSDKFFKLYTIRKRYSIINNSVSYAYVTNNDDQKFIAKFYDKNDHLARTRYYKDMIFCSMIKSSNILKYKDSFDSEMVNLFSMCSEDTLLSYMLHEKSKTSYSFTYSKAIVIMKQVATALGHIHKQKIVHGNIKPSNIIFATSRDLYSLKVIGFDNASLFEQSRQIDDRFDEMVD